MKIAIDKIYILVYTNSDTNEVSVNKIGDIVMLIPMTNQWSSFIQAVNMFSDDFFENGREDSEPQEREKL